MKRLGATAGPALCGAALLAFCSCSRPAGTGEDDVRQQWEYRLVDVGELWSNANMPEGAVVATENLEGAAAIEKLAEMSLNKLGEEGWQLCGVFGGKSLNETAMPIALGARPEGTLVLRRPKRQPASAIASGGRDAGEGRSRR